MRLEWKTFSVSSSVENPNLRLEMPFEALFFFIRDRSRGCIKYGRLSPITRPDSIEDQLVYLLSEVKKEGSQKENLEVVFVTPPQMQPIVHDLLKVFESFTIPVTVKKTRSEVNNRVKLNPFTGELWVLSTQIPNPLPAPLEGPKKTRVLIVEDSIPVQMILKKVFSETLGVEVIGIEASVKGAVQFLNSHEVDLVSLDMKLESGTGVDFLNQSNFKNYAKKNQTKCLLVTECSPSEGGLVFEAMKLGATSYFQKPQAKNLNDFARDLRELIDEMFVKVKSPDSSTSKKLKLIDLKDFSLMVIGSSTGGTEVVAEIIAGLPLECPPVVVVQHMPAQFTSLYADRLSRSTGKKTYEINRVRELERGCAYIAAGGYHAEIEKNGRRLQVVPKSGDPVNRFKPSVSVLFESVMKADVAEKTLALILTGMGSDGANEMLELKKNGALTLGQSKESCAVYGMPRAAEELGALVHVASPEQMIRAFQRVS